MKTVRIEQGNLDVCVRDAQTDRVIVTRNGLPVAIIVGIEGMNYEQLQLGASEPFWRLIAERRAQKTISRSELESRLKSRSSSKKAESNPW